MKRGFFMQKLTISQNKDYFLVDGKPFFMLADTAWATFARATKEEWEQYLDTRKIQGFNGMQFSMLPIVSDCTRGENDRFPFVKKEEGSYDFDKLDETYFDFAEDIIKMTVKADMVPVITLIWVTYVKGSWANRKCPEYTLTWEQCDKYLEYVLQRFQKYNPIYFVSGDARLDEETLDIEIYNKALKKVQEMAPEALVSMHIAGRQTYYPESYKAEDTGLDFYTYQSGHPYDTEGAGYELAQEESKFPSKPIWSNEVCYEGHAKTRGHLKHTAYDVRRASWESYFGGAKVGITYGAHGIWSWHRREDIFISEYWSGSMEPWYIGLQYEGAWDMAFMKWFCMHFKLYDFNPYKLQLLEDKMRDTVGLCAMQSQDQRQLVLYVPSPTNIYLKEDLTEYEWEAFDLKTRFPYVPVIKRTESGSIMQMVNGKEDALYIGHKK